MSGEEVLLASIKLQWFGVEQKWSKAWRRRSDDWSRFSLDGCVASDKIDDERKLESILFGQVRSKTSRCKQNELND